jgi:hypothetical protein
MSNSPPTFGTDPALHTGISWSDFATLHHRDYGGGLLFEFKVIRRGSLAALARHMMRLPKLERRNYVVEIPGDHRLDFVEIEALTKRSDFPDDEETAI